MKKHIQLRKQLIKRGILLAIIALVLGGAYSWVYAIEQGYADERKRITASINQINSRIQNMDNTFKKAKASLDLYEQLQQSENGAESALSRANIADSLNTLKNRYKLESLALRMTPVKDLDDKRFLTDTTAVIQTEITLSFSGMTDELLFSFISDVLQSLPGYTRVSFLRMKREGGIDDNFLSAVNKEQYPALVTGEVAFHLLGMKKTANEEDKDKAQNGSSADESRGRG